MLDTENRGKARKKGRYQIQKKTQNGYLNSYKDYKKMYTYNTTFNLIKLTFNF